MLPWLLLLVSRWDAGVAVGEKGLGWRREQGGGGSATSGHPAYFAWMHFLTYQDSRLPQGQVNRSFWVGVFKIDQSGEEIVEPVRVGKRGKPYQGL